VHETIVHNQVLAILYGLLLILGKVREISPKEDVRLLVAVRESATVHHQHCVWQVIQHLSQSDVRLFLLHLHDEELGQCRPDKIRRHAHHPCIDHGLLDDAEIVDAAWWLVLVYLEHLYHVEEGRDDKSEEEFITEWRAKDRKTCVDVDDELSEIYQ